MMANINLDFSGIDGPVYRLYTMDVVRQVKNLLPKPTEQEFDAIATIGEQTILLSFLAGDDSEECASRFVLIVASMVRHQVRRKGGAK